MTAAPTRPRLSLAQASSIAEELVDLLAPFCERLQVCGSIRRRTETVGDVDLVAISKLVPIAGLFDGPPSGYINDLNFTLDDLCGRQVIHQARRADGKLAGWGPRLRKLTFRDVPVQIRQASADNFGLVVLIATGPAAFSHAFVTPRGTKAVIRSSDGKPRYHRAGLLPPGFEVRDGFRLYRTGGLVPTPDEESVYEALGWAYTHPEDRR